MRTELFGLRITIEAETAGNEVKLMTAVEDVESTLGQLARLPLPVMSRAAALIEQHLAELYTAAHMAAFRSSLGESNAPDISEFGGRHRPSSN
ncbi:MAG: hypothetical protein KF873_03035 [Gemmataceae bacterium]|nr:hypothetical protein [Gemmataceae bacterium]